MNRILATEETTPTTLLTETNYEVRFHRSLSWGAILAGVVVAIGIHILLLTLGLAIGLATFTPLTDVHPAEAFTIGTAIAWGICALIALYVGGWVAGCFSAGPKSGCIHALVVWSGTLILSVALASAGSGLALGGALKALGLGLGITGTAGVTSLSQNAASGVQQGADQIKSFVNEGVKSSPTASAPNVAVRAQRELTQSLTQLFAEGNDVNSKDGQAAVTKALTDAGVSQPDAQKLVNEWVASYNDFQKAKFQAEQKARVLADEASNKLAVAAGISFFVLLASLIVTVCGGIRGAKRMFWHTAHGMVAH